MNIELSTGLNYLYQWDTNINLKIPDEIPEAHFRFGNKAGTVEAKDGWVEVPNQLMQKPYDIEVWTYDKEHTMDFGVIECRRRPKPSTYVYTPTEVKTWSDLDERIRALSTAVLYTEQELTEEQKSQARENIDVEGSHYGWKPCKYIFTSSGSISTILYMAEGEIKQLDLDTASDDLKNAWIQLYRLAIFSPYYGLGHNADTIHSSLKKFWLLYNNGIFGDTLEGDGYRRITFGIFQDFNGRVHLDNKLQIFLKRDYIAVTSSAEGGASSAGRMTPSKDNMDLWEVHDYYLRTTATQDHTELALDQIEMSSAPTEDMHIATKKYVDDKTIAPTSDDSLELLTETGIITPAYQDGTIYTAPTGEIYVI